MKEKYTCLCCGYKTLDYDTGYDVCVLCGWEDDPDSWDNLYHFGGPNGSETLFYAQKRFLLHGMPSYWRKLGYPSESSYEKDKDWEPFQENYRY